MAFGDRLRQKARDRASGAIAEHLEAGEQVQRAIMGLHTRVPILALEVISPLLIFVAVPYYVVLTDRRVVFLRYSRWSVRRIWFAFAYPLHGASAARIRRGLINFTLRMTFEDRTLRLYVSRIFRTDAEAIAAAVKAG